MRKIVGGVCLLVYMVAYVALIAGLSGHATGWSRGVQLMFFAVAGCIWVAPLRPLIVWMHK